jgi:hypothetical protein
MTTLTPELKQLFDRDMTVRVGLVDGLVRSTGMRRANGERNMAGLLFCHDRRTDGRGKTYP